MVKVSTTRERLTQLFDQDSRNDSQIADALGVSKQAVSTWRTGTRSPTVSMVKKISEFYNVPVEWIMGYEMEESDAVPRYVSQSDYDRLEALHQNPRLGMLFDHSRKMSKEDVDFMIQFAERILKERDNDA